MIEYLGSTRFKRYLADWILVFILIWVYFWITEPAEPFFRQFSVGDARISHPFARSERVTDNMLYLYSCVLPTVVVSLLTTYYKKDVKDKIHFLQLSLLGLWLAISIVGVFTDLLKNWIGNPRPDFLERCGAKPGTPVNTLVDINVCSAPLGEMYLTDGMKSTPSAHSSMAFSGLVYLSLWLFENLGILGGRSKSFLRAIVYSSPLILAFYIALSRVQDYRHHFFDVFLGSVIGSIFAVALYNRFFPLYKKEIVQI